jgi:hypothetical protein
MLLSDEWIEITTPYDDGCVFVNKHTGKLYRTWENRMDLKELLKQKQQKQQFNQQTKQQKVPVLMQKPVKKVTGRGR